eukprot:COSAG03_NODE_4454_length_1548_cov_1.714286_1_plen_73_part_00
MQKGMIIKNGRMNHVIPMPKAVKIVRAKMMIHVVQAQHVGVSPRILWFEMHCWYAQRKTMHGKQLMTTARMT